jgi:HEAT repeat protein
MRKNPLASHCVALALIIIAHSASAAPDPQPPANPRSTAELLAAFRAAGNSIGQQEAAAALLKADDRKAVIEAMLPLLDATDRRTRCNAGWILGAFGDARGFDAVLKELQDAVPRAVQQGRIRSDGRPDFQGQVTSDRYYAIHILGELKDRRAVPALVAVLNDPVLDYQAAIALGKIGSRDAVEPLKRMSQSASPSSRLLAFHALAKLGESSGLPALLAALADDDPPQRALAAELLGEMKDPRVLPALLAALKDTNILVRRRTIGALSVLGDRAALPTLRETSGDRTPLANGETRTIGNEAAEAEERIEKQ